MGDPENTIPPSKKRAAGRELSRDNPGLDDEDEDVFDQTGTFKRASEEVLANRKIVKVRRNRTPSAPSAPSNPFASIRLIPPTDSASNPVTVTNVQEAAKTAREVVESQEDAKKESGGITDSASNPAMVTNVQETAKTACEVAESREDAKTESGNNVQETAKPACEVAESREDAKKESGNNVQETAKPACEAAESREDAKKESGSNGQETAKPACEVAESREDAKKESGNNAKPACEVAESREDAKKKKESANIVQKTAKTACEAVESRKDAKKESGKEEIDGNRQPADDEKHYVPGDARNPESADAKNETESNEIENDENTKTTESVSVSSFQQLSSSQNAFTGLIGTGFSSSTFSFGSITKTDHGTPSLFSNPVGTKKPSIEEIQLETGEENETTVFAADSVLFEFLDGGWKERGKGEVKVNVSRTGTGKGRLVMRSKGNYRLILNASLFADMKMTKMEKKGITFACLNSNGEGQNGLSTFALKFKDAAIVEEFCGRVNEHKGNDNKPLKTP